MSAQGCFCLGGICLGGICLGYLPRGCLPGVGLSAQGEGVYPGGVSAQVVSAQRWGCLSRGVCPGGCLPGWCLLGVYPNMHIGRHPPGLRGRHPMWTEFLTHTCENITFPQLCLRMVKITNLVNFTSVKKILVRIN